MLLIYYLFNIMLLELQNIYIFIRILYRYNSYDLDFVIMYILYMFILVFLKLYV